MIVESAIEWLKACGALCQRIAVELTEPRIVEDSETSSRSVFAEAMCGSTMMQIMCWEKGDCEVHILSGEALEVVYKEVHTPEQVKRALQEAFDIFVLRTKRPGARNNCTTASSRSRKQDNLWTHEAFDPQGSVAQRQDSSGGLISASAYDAYGAESSTVMPSDPFGWNGRWGLM